MRIERIGDAVLYNGDCLEVMRSLPANSVDAIVTDPPYHLTSIVKRFGGKNAAPAKSKETGAFARASRGFMGQTWDGGDIAFRPETWEEALRVLKPGGHIAAFSGTRTYHRMAVAIEDAGFEIRDQLAWTYGSGFPKSHDVSKGIEKRRTEDVEPVRVVCRFIRAAMDAKGLKSRNLVDHFGGCNPRLIDHWAARDSDSQPSLPTPEQWETLKAVLGFGSSMDDEVARLNARKGEFGADWHAREITGSVTEWADRSNYALTSRDGLRRDDAATDAARQWQGWGSALKPAWEPICLARKPLDGTIAENVLAHGVGALNIDGCRVEGVVTTNPSRRGADAARQAYGQFNGQIDTGLSRVSDLGRWPANILHDGEAGFGEQGRFFYCAKASKADRGEGNNHPTVKPTELMRWLCRLITPPGGLVLDPFTGSGSTGRGAVLEGFRFVGAELSEEYAAIALKRIAAVIGQNNNAPSAPAQAGADLFSVAAA